MQHKAHGAQRPRQYTKYGEEARTAQRSDAPAQPTSLRFYTCMFMIVVYADTTLSRTCTASWKAILPFCMAIMA